MSAGRYINNIHCGTSRIKRNSNSPGQTDGGGPPVRVYFKPAHSGADTIYHTYDDAWKRANGIGLNLYEGGNIFMLLDPDNFWKVLPDNIHGHKWRLTGETGGYYDTATGQYKTVDGVVTTKTLAYPGGVMQCHHTGIMLPTSPAFIQALYVEGGVNSFADVQALVLAGYEDWQMPDDVELLAFINKSKTSPASAAPFDGWNAAYQKWTGTTYKTNTTQAWALQLQGGMAATAKSTVRAIIPIRHWA